MNWLPSMNCPRWHLQVTCVIQAYRAAYKHYNLYGSLLKGFPASHDINLIIVTACFAYLLIIQGEVFSWKRLVFYPLFTHAVSKKSTWKLEPDCSCSVIQLLQTENAGLSILDLVGKGSLAVRTSPLFNAACCYRHYTITC